MKIFIPAVLLAICGSAQQTCFTAKNGTDAYSTLEAALGGSPIENPDYGPVKCHPVRPVNKNPKILFEHNVKFGVGLHAHSLDVQQFSE
jgi:hypothetical protein